MNKKRAAGDINPDHEALSDDQLAELGDESPHFKYTI
jgi:hypothetical protein